jgi:hypothetical protein
MKGSEEREQTKGDFIEKVAKDNNIQRGVGIGVRSEVTN